MSEGKMITNNGARCTHTCTGGAGEGAGTSAIKDVSREDTERRGKKARDGGRRTAGGAGGWDQKKKARAHATLSGH